MPRALHADSAAQIAAFLSALPTTANVDQRAAGHAAADALQRRLESFLLAADADAIVDHVIRHDPPLHNTRRFLASRFRYRPLPNARVPQFAFSKEPNP
ncbi:Uncharacterised protein [Achromobacter spanius]|uniref:hypothetical protein n=1 Tax=Achromobacter spanius TaxID=217203 RepID=UPI000D8F9AC6|nr:hypothetical protein [Achromobacter spanius]CAB3655297.1 hypothetical protein LMG5911_02670 [Achromobacter spanius]SPT37111.1 Uncharacterised protein [Achromobacter denitrificans]VEE58243.1 Uncharacterised protein [Achromobacter spanius]